MLRRQSPLGVPSHFGLVSIRHRGRGLGFEGARIASLDDDGRLTGAARFSVREISDEFDTTKNERPRFAISQDTGGDWLLIAY